MFKGKKLKALRRLIDDVKAVRIAHRRPFRFLNPLLILSVAIRPQALERRFPSIVLDFIADKRIDRRIKKVRQLHEHAQLRHAQPRFPFIDCASRHAECFGKLFLCQIPLLAHPADIVVKLQFHVSSLLVCAYYIKPHSACTRTINTNGKMFFQPTV